MSERGGLQHVRKERLCSMEELRGTRNGVERKKWLSKVAGWEENCGKRRKRLGRLILHVSELGCFGLNCVPSLPG